MLKVQVLEVLKVQVLKVQVLDVLKVQHLSAPLGTVSTRTIQHLQHL